MKISDADFKILQTILVETDVLWTPFRFNTTPRTAAAAIMERREDYRERGLPLAARGAAANRQSMGRRYAALQRSGFLTLASVGARRLGKLTDHGYQWIRSAAPCPKLDEHWHLLQTLADWPEKNTQAGFALEVDILGITYAAAADDTKPLTDLEDFLLAYLVLGWVDAYGDGEGRIGYRITPAGRAALAAGCPSPPADAPKYNSRKHYSAYAAPFFAGLRDRATWQSAHTGHVAIPLSGGLWMGQRR